MLSSVIARAPFSMATRTLRNLILPSAESYQPILTSKTILPTFNKTQSVPTVQKRLLSSTSPSSQLTFALYPHHLSVFAYYHHSTPPSGSCLSRCFHTASGALYAEEKKNSDGFRVISPTTGVSAAAKKRKEVPPSISVTFVLENGERLTAKGRVGDTLLDVVQDNDLDIDGFGACEGTLSCSTCHLILKKEDFDRLPNKPADEELDMLDLAYDLTDTSRLGCQVYLTKEMDGLVVDVPASVNDVRLI